MTTSNGNDASAQSAHPQGADSSHTNQQIANLLQKGERLLTSAFAFPLLFAFFLLDLIPALQQMFLLLGVLLVAGLCAEEYTAFLRAKGCKAPAGLGFYSGLIPPLVAFCWRPPFQPAVSLGLLSIFTLALVFCSLMVALSLIAEVSERLATGLAVFLLASGVSLLIGFVLSHLLLLRQMGVGYLPPLAALALGWVWALVNRPAKDGSRMLPLVLRFAGLGATATFLFWLIHIF